jgi:hypothetical protein
MNVLKMWSNRNNPRFVTESDSVYNKKSNSNKTLSVYFIMKSTRTLNARTVYYNILQGTPSIKKNDNADTIYVKSNHMLNKTQSHILKH